MTMCRRFHGEPVTRLIASVPKVTVMAIDDHIDRNKADHIANYWGERWHPVQICRSEFIRLAILEKLERDKRARRGVT